MRDLKVRGLAKCGKPGRIYVTERKTRTTWTKTARETYRRNCERFETDVSDRERALVERLILLSPKMGRRSSRSVQAIQLMPAAGCRWQAISPCFQPSATIWNYCCAWRDGLWMRRRRTPDTLVVMLFANRLVLPRGSRGCATAVGDL